MSRAAPPFPTSNGGYRRPRSPSNGVPNNSYTGGAAGMSTPPLAINRGAPRPTTPNSMAGSSKPGSPNPSRPVRSDLRPRQTSQYSVGSSRTGVSENASGSSSTERPRYTSETSSRRRDDVANEPSPISPLSPASPVLSAVAAAFQSAGSSRRAVINGDTERRSERDREVQKEKERQRRIRDKVQGRRVNGKGRPGDIDAVLDQITDEWESVIDPDFNPVDLALSLLDDSSLGKDMRSFQQTKRLLEKSLKGTVDKHYQSFAAALPHHASLLTSLTATQTQITDTRSTLQEAKDALGNKRADLVQLWSRGQTVEEMLRLLDQIEHLKSVPDILESLMSEKRLLQAAVLLVRSLKTISRSDMLEIGAVSDLRSYLAGQETALKEILIEELHGHLYLKTFWCDSRWSPYTPGQQMIPVVGYEKSLIANEPAKALSLEIQSRPQRLYRFINNLMVRANQAPADASEELDLQAARGISSAPATLAGPPSTSGNPESDSFGYIETLLESLAVLGQLGSALDIVAQRLPVEVYSLFEATIDEVNERAEFNKRMLLLGPGSTGRPVSVFGGSQATASRLRLPALESSVKEADQEVLRDLFWTMYSKLDAVLQGLRVVYEVATRIGSRRDFKDSSGTKPGALFPLAELWPPVQSEIRTLLHDYLMDEERGAASGRNPISSINEVLREGRTGRDRSKPVFRFGDSDSKLAIRALKRHEDELTRVLKETVPGLVHGPSDHTTQSTLAQTATDDRFVDAGHHQVLIKPDAFHVSVLFQPTLAFLDRVVEILPSGMDAARASSVFLDEFVLNVYLPQLEEKVQSLFQSAISDPDAFQPDTFSSALSSQPLVKASTQLAALINSLCVMLRTTPFHRENYSRLILGVIIQFYQQCSDHFRNLVSRGDPSNPSEFFLSTSAVWAQRPELTACLSAINGSVGDEVKKQSLCRQEARIELQLLGNDSIRPEDLITSNRKLTSLGQLYHSLIWFNEQLTSLKSLTDEPISPGNGDVLEPPTARTPFTPRLPILPPVRPDEQLRLPLTRAMALRFDALQKTYEQLAEMVLFTFRTDIRCRAIHYLNLSIRRGNYQLEHEPVEPDPHVVELNIEIGKCDDAAVASLPERERRFVFEGLGSLMEQVLISGSRRLRVVNDHGVKKILRNVIALQQNLKTLTDGPRDTGLERAKQFYGLFSLTPSDMLKGIKEKKPQFTFDEYRSMLNFQCGVDQSLGDAGAAQATDRDYNMHLIELHGLAIGDIMGDGES